MAFEFCICEQSLLKQLLESLASLMGKCLPIIYPEKFNGNDNFKKACSIQYKSVSSAILTSMGNIVYYCGGSAAMLFFKSVFPRFHHRVGS